MQARSYHPCLDTLTHTSTYLPCERASLELLSGWLLIDILSRTQYGGCAGKKEVVFEEEERKGPVYCVCCSARNAPAGKQNNMSTGTRRCRDLRGREVMCKRVKENEREEKCKKRETLRKGKIREEEKDRKEKREKKEERSKKREQKEE